jgi:hypothetical protein
MLAVSGFAGDVFSGLAGVRSAYTAFLMSTSSLNVAQILT